MTVSELAPEGSPEFIALTAALAMLAGFFSILAGLLRFGRISQFFSESVLTGFTFGLAMVIAIKQVPKLFGFEAVEGNFFVRAWDILTRLDESHRLTRLIGLTSIALMVFLERRFKKIPAALVAFAEAIGPARSYGAKYGYRVNADQELIALGAADFGAGLFQGFPIGASLSKTAANENAGVKSQMSALIAAAATILVALFMTPLFRNLPEATLAAIVTVAIAGMMNVSEMRRLLQLRRRDFTLAVVALLAVLTFEVLVGLFIAVAVSLLTLIARASEPRFSVLGRIRGA